MTAAPELKTVTYDGPQCPWCERRLPDETLRTGSLRCPLCNRVFEATAFHPPQRKVTVLETAQSGPEGVNACANHPLNTAVTTCQRCGIFICSLCDMNVGSGSHCPACFDRLRNEGSLQGAKTRFRDYASMARTSAIVGFLFMFFFLGLPFGALTLYYARKAYKQRRAESRPTGGVRVAAVFGLIELVIGIATTVFVVMGLSGAFK